MFKFFSNKQQTPVTRERKLTPEEITAEQLRLWKYYQNKVQQGKDAESNQILATTAAANDQLWLGRK